jgi:hypothetical protein
MKILKEKFHDAHQGRNVEEKANLPGVIDRITKPFS